MTRLAWKDTITIYLHTEGGYTRQVINNCFWDDSEKLKAMRQGTPITHSVLLFIPWLESLENFVLGVERANPYIVRGECDFELTDVNIREFEAEYKGMFWRPKAISPCNYGSRAMWHYEAVM
ncbi:MAG: hypothetical protein LBL34_04790 [Clostridiales bacterium]|jgi:hypothetical protein|nr:hypothetical protein [Clostridiales bacterium]